MNDAEILAFIDLFADGKRMFTHGLCYWFAVILDQRFPKLGKIVYDPVAGHFLWQCSIWAYDIDGRHPIPERARSLNWFRRNDSVWYKRLERECIKITGR